MKERKHVFSSCNLSTIHAFAFLLLHPDNPQPASPSLHRYTHPTPHQQTLYRTPPLRWRLPKLFLHNPKTVANLNYKFHLTPQSSLPHHPLGFLVNGMVS